MRLLPLGAGVFALLTALPAVVVAQKSDVPPRPRLAATADTNDHQAYYGYGLQVLQRQPDQAAAAFYWASRLAPTWADAYYARRVALHLSDKKRLFRYLIGDKPIVNSRQIRAIDSLASEALIRNPFFYPRFDRLMWQQALAHVSEGRVYLDGHRSGDAAYDAWMAFADARFEDATRLYGDALRRKPREYGLRAPRARAYFLRQHFDSAAHELTLLLDVMRKRDEKKLVYFYDSKAMFEYSLARAYYQQDDHDKAREALGRALEEDLSFYMAHVDLAELALLQRDTATAISELALAVELRGDDAGVRLRYADALAAASQPDEAIVQYRAAIEQEPFYAQPYYNMAKVLDGQGKAAEASENYREFLARAARSRSEVPLARARLAQLASGGDGDKP